LKKTLETICAIALVPVLLAFGAVCFVIAFLPPMILIHHLLRGSGEPATRFELLISVIGLFVVWIFLGSIWIKLLQIFFKWVVSWCETVIYIFRLRGEERKEFWANIRNPQKKERG
jgi:hypothetical protein